MLELKSVRETGCGILHTFSYVYLTRVPNMALPGHGTKIHFHQCHHSNQRIRFYTYQATLDFGLPVLDCTPTSTCRPNAWSSLPTPSPPSSADRLTTSAPVKSWRRAGEADIQRTTRWAGPGDQTRHTTNQNICQQTNFALYRGDDDAIPAPAEALAHH